MTEYRLQLIAEDNQPYFVLQYKTFSHHVNSNMGHSEIDKWSDIPLNVYGLVNLNKTRIWGGLNDKHILVKFIKDWPDIQPYLDGLQAEYDELVSLS